MKIMFKLDINKINIIRMFIVTHLVLFAIGILFDIHPFMSYDDKEIYFTSRLMNVLPFSYYLENRQIFIFLSAVLNSIIFKGEYINGTRIFNIIVSLFMVFEYRKILDVIDDDKNLKHKATKYLTITPVIVLWCSTLYKDVLCAYLVAILFNKVYRFLMKNEIKIVSTSIVIVLLYFTRAGILEAFLALALIFYVIYKKSRKKIYIIAIVSLIGLLLLSKYYTIYKYLVDQKVKAYLGERTFNETGLLRYIRINNISQIWKLPICIIWLQLAPIPSVTMDGMNWYTIAGFYSILNYYIFPYFWIYMFKFKKKIIEKFILIFYFAWIAIIAYSSLDNIRFCVFIMPIYFVFGYVGLYRTKNIKGQFVNIAKIVSITLPLLWLVHLVRSLYLKI